MRTPSRFLFPLPPERTLPVRYLFLFAAIALAGLGWSAIRFFRDDDPLFIVLLVSGLLLLIFGKISEKDLQEKRKNMAQQRAGQGICQFARSFDVRAVDSWVIRAVWQTLDRHVNQQMTPAPPLPLLATDRLDEDLDLVGDEYDLEDLLTEAAARCGRDLHGIERNAFLPISTVRDLVLALNAQPATPQRRQHQLISPP